MTGIDRSPPAGAAVPRSVLGFRLPQGKARMMAQVVGLRVLSLVVNVCTGLLTAAMLGPGGRGQQAALIVIPQFCGGAALLGLHASLIYNVKRDPRNEGGYLGTGILIALGYGVVATVIGWLLAPWWLWDQSPGIVAASRGLLLITPLLAASPLLLASLEARGRFDVSNGSLYLQGLLTLLALTLLWTAHRLTPLSAAIAYLAPSLLAWGYFIPHLRRIIPPPFRPRRALVRPLVHFGLRFCGVDLLGTMAMFMDQLILVSIAAPRVVGHYVVALSVARVLGVVQGAVTTVLFPSVAARPQASVVETVATVMRVTVAVSTVAAIGMILVGPTLIRTVYGPAFEEAVGPFRLLTFETVVASAVSILCQAFSGTGRPGFVTMIEAVGATVSVASMVLVVPRFGATGAAACVLLASCVRLACVIAGLPVVLRVRMPRLILSRMDLRFTEERG